MSMQRISSGSGYLYLVNQVATNDTSRGRDRLHAYYEEKGESPGVWAGSGLAGMEGVQAGDQVTAPQMLALFGEGRQPNADAIQERLIRGGASVAEALKATQLGYKFPEYSEAPEFLQRCAVEFRDVNLAAGRRWNAALPDEQRAAIRTQVALNMFSEIHSRPPLDEQELHGFIARNSRPPKTAVAAFDHVFTPPKTVSVLWAVAPLQVADRVEAAHRESVGECLRWFEANVAYTRAGAGGKRRIDTRGVSAAVFQHRDSRAGDPNLHTHVAISSKVQGGDGRWRSLDSQVVHSAVVSMSERYNTVMMNRLRALGLPVVDRDMGAGKRPVQEIGGVPAQLAEVWSSRSQMIRARQGVLAGKFQAEHGRPPSPVEAVALAEQANLETRQGKHAPRSYAEQRQEWAETAAEVLGPTGTAEFVAEVTAGLGRPGPVVLVASDQAARDLAEGVLRTVGQERARWSFWHLHAEADRAVRAAGVAPQHVNRMVREVTRNAMFSPAAVRLTPVDDVERSAPPELWRRGTDRVYEGPHSALFTSAEMLAAERRVVSAAARVDGRAVSAADIDMALLEWSANHGGNTLNTGQELMVREMATSGRRVQLCMAPAGTGKTTAMGVLAAAWANGGGTVVGFSPTAVAAEELSKAIGGQRAVTLDLLRVHLENEARLRPAWVNQIGPGSLLIVDEAGMASTANLDVVVGFAMARGASVRLVGDDKQQSSASAGGLLRDVRAEHGAVALSEVVRFRDPGEAGPSLALAAGDESALGFYLDRGRVHVGDVTTVVDGAFAAWQAARDAGKDAVISAPTRDVVTELNERARAARLSTTPEGARVGLAGGVIASVGDTIITRRNRRALATSATDFVKNGDRWIIESVTTQGQLNVRRAGTGPAVRIQLPDWYVAEHVQLGYAVTAASVEGVTADVGIAVIDPRMTRNLLYVAATRGRDSNDLFVPVTGDGDEHSVVDEKSVSPQSAAEVLAGILGREDPNKSALTTLAELRDPGTALGDMTGRWLDALPLASEAVLGDTNIKEILFAVKSQLPGVDDAPAWDTLREHLVLLALSGGDPAAAVAAARDVRPLGDARDVAAVLDYRIDPTGNHSQPAGVLPWLPALPAALAQSPVWGAYLTGRQQQIAQLADQVRAVAAGWTPSTAPAWARPYLGDQALVTDLALWRASRSVPPDDLRPAGAPAGRLALRARQDALTKRAMQVGGDLGLAGERWAALLPPAAAHVERDPFWPVLAGRLNMADRIPGVHVMRHLIRAIDEGPLPAEHSASALWWRVARHIAPTAGERVLSSVAARPAWTPVLAAQLGERRAAAVIEDAMWPAIIARVDQAARDGMDAEDLVSAAAGLLSAHTDESLPLSLTATALLYQIGEVAEPLPIEEEMPPDPESAEFDMPEDLHTLGELWPDTHGTVQETGPPPEVEPPYFGEPPMLAVEDLAFVRLPEEALPVPERVAALTAQLDAARARWVELRDQVHAPTSVPGHIVDGGPMFRAAQPMLHAMYLRAEMLRPLLVTAHAAQAEYLLADDLAADARTEAADALDAVLTARTAGADPAVLGRLEPAAAEAQRLAGEASVVSSAMFDRWQAAQSAVTEAAAGGPITTDDDIFHARMLAVGMDQEQVNELRSEVDRLESAVWRAHAAEQSAAQPAAGAAGPALPRQSPASYVARQRGVAGPAVDAPDVGM